MTQYLIPTPQTRIEKEAFSFIPPRAYTQENMRSETTLAHNLGELTHTLEAETLYTGKTSFTITGEQLLFEVVDATAPASVIADTQHFTVEENAHLTHVRLHIGAGENAQNVIHRKVEASLQKGATYSQFTLNLGNTAARTETNISLDGEAAHVDLWGINMLTGSQKADSTADMQFKAPGCTANVEQRQIVSENAHAAFQGKFHVHQIAQKTDAYMMCKSLLLDELARTSQKPELEIYADDVKCSHGTTTGQLDDEALFYLEARGIPTAKARAMLIEAFAAEIASNITSSKAQETVEKYIQQFLSSVK